MIEVDQPQHLCRREPERGDEALDALPDPGRAVGDEEHLVSGVEADLPRVRQQQGEDRLRSPERAVDDRGPRLRRSPVVADDVQDEELRFLPVGMESVAPLLRLGATLLAPHTDAAPVEGDDHPLPGHAVQQTARRALLGRSGPRSVAIGGRAEGLDIQGDAVGAELRLRFGQRAEHGDRAACIRGQLHRQLAGDQRRGALGAVLDHLGQVAPLGVAQRRQHPIVDGEQVELRQTGEQSRVGAVPAADGQFVQQARHAEVARGEAAAACPFDECTRQKGNLRERNLAIRSGLPLV